MLSVKPMPKGTPKNIADLLADHPHGLTSREIAHKFGETDASVVYPRCEALAKAGTIRKEMVSGIGGINAKWFLS